MVLLDWGCLAVAVACLVLQEAKNMEVYNRNDAKSFIYSGLSDVKGRYLILN